MADNQHQSQNQESQATAQSSPTSIQQPLSSPSLAATSTPYDSSTTNTSTHIEQPPSSHSPAYTTQNLPEQYIKISVLQDYLNSKPDEFGSGYRLQSIRGHHRVTAKRELTSDEL